MQLWDSNAGLCFRFTGLRSAKLLKRDSKQIFSCEISEIFKNNYFKKHLRTAVSSMLCVLHIYFNNASLCFWYRSENLAFQQNTVLLLKCLQFMFTRSLNDKRLILYYNHLCRNQTRISDHVIKNNIYNSFFATIV